MQTSTNVLQQLHFKLEISGARYLEELDESCMLNPGETKWL